MLTILDMPPNLAQGRADVHVSDEGERIIAELAEIRAQSERASDRVEQLRQRLEQILDRLRNGESGADQDEGGEA